MKMLFVLSLLVILIFFFSVADLSVGYSSSSAQLSPFSAKVSDNTDLQIIITNVTVVDSGSLNVSYNLINSLNHNIIIETVDGCPAFSSRNYIFPDNASPFISYGSALGCTSAFTNHTITPGFHSNWSYAQANGSSLPNGEYFTEMVPRSYLMFPQNATFQSNSVSFNFTNNTISNFSNYTRRTNLYQHTYISITNVSYSGFVSSSNQILFDVDITITTFNGKSIYPHARSEDLYSQLELQLEGVDSTNFGPLNSSVSNGHHSIGVPDNYFSNFTYNYSSLSDGNYSLHFIAPGLILDNNSNIATFQIVNNTLSDLHISNLNLNFLNSSTSSSSSSPTTTSSLSTTRSSSNVTSTPKSTAGFTLIVPIFVIMVLVLIRRFKFKN